MKMRKSTRPIQGTNTQGGHRAVDIHLNASTKVAQRAVERDLTESTMRENGEPRTYGYIRVSSREQNEARQVVALHDFGITDECIFLDKQSGKDFNRPAYQRLIRMLQAGEDILVKNKTLLACGESEACAKLHDEFLQVIKQPRFKFCF